MQSIPSYEYTKDCICFESGGRIWLVPVGLRFDEQYAFVDDQGMHYSLCIKDNDVAVSRFNPGHVPEEQMVTSGDIGDLNAMNSQETLDAAISFLGW